MINFNNFFSGNTLFLPEYISMSKPFLKGMAVSVRMKNNLYPGIQCSPI